MGQKNQQRSFESLDLVRARQIINKQKSKPLKLIKTLQKSYIASLFRKPPVWTNSSIWVTRKCNLHCDYCWATDDKAQEMTTDEIKRVIDIIESVGCKYLTFYGGEPTLRKDLPEMIEHAAKKGIFTYLPTNGTLLDKDYIARLGKAGIDAIDLAIDSLDESESKNLPKVRKTLDLLVDGNRKYGFELKLNHNITKRNIGQIDEFLDFVIKLKVPTSTHLGINPPIPPAGYKPSPDLFTTQENEYWQKEVDKVANTLIKRVRSSRLMTTEPIEYYKAWQRFVRGRLEDWRCDAGKYSFSVNNDGRLLQCVSILEPFDVTIFDVDKKGRYYKQIQAKVEENLATCTKNCISCAYYDSAYFRRHPLQFLGKMLRWSRK